MRRTKKLAAWLAAGLIAAWPMAGAAQDSQPNPNTDESSLNISVLERSHPEYEPLGVRVGSFVLRPSAEFEAGYTDNLFVEQTGEDSDGFGTIGVRLPFQSDWTRHALRFDVAAQRRMHIDFPSDDSTTGHAELAGRYDVATGASLNGRYRAARLVEPRFSPESGSDVRKPVRYNLQEAGAGADWRLNRWRLRTDVLWRDLNYKDAPGMLLPLVDQDARDRSERFASARVDYEMGPGWGLMAEARYNQRDFDLEPPAVFEDRDSDGQTYLVGATFDVTRLVRGQVALGYLKQDYEAASLGWIEGLAADIAVEWFPTDLTSVTFTASRSVEESAYYGSGSYTIERAGLRVDHELYRNVVLTGAANFGHREFRGIDREDDVTTLDAGAAWRLNRNVTLRANWRFEGQDSSGAQRYQNADVNELTMGVAFGL